MKCDVSQRAQSTNLSWASGTSGRFRHVSIYDMLAHKGEQIGCSVYALTVVLDGECVCMCVCVAAVVVNSE